MNAQAKASEYRYSPDVYAAYGRAAHAGQLLEKELVTFLMYPTFARKQPLTLECFMSVIKKLNKSPLGPLLSGMKEVVSIKDLAFDAFCQRVSDARNFLIHDFFCGWNALIDRPAIELLDELEQTQRLLDKAYHLFRGANDTILRAQGLSPVEFAAKLMEAEREAAKASGTHLTS